MKTTSTTREYDESGLLIKETTTSECDCVVLKAEPISVRGIDAKTFAKELRREIARTGMRLS